MNIYCLLDLKQMKNWKKKKNEKKKSLEIFKTKKRKNQGGGDLKNKHKKMLILLGLKKPKNGKIGQNNF